MSTLYVGVDIAKKKFATEVIDETRRVLWQRSYPNTEKGYAQLWRKLSARKAARVQVCMEATGTYWEGLAHYAHARHAIVQVVNPARVKYYARAEGLRQKTDAIDAGVTARFSLTQVCLPWAPPTPALRELQAISRRMDDISLMLQKERNRASSAVDVLTAASVARMQHALKDEYETLVRAFDAVLKRAPAFAHEMELLCSIVGVSVRTARRLLVFLRRTPYDTARQAAAAGGITPTHYSSGMKDDKHPRISRMGDAALRHFLYSPAMVAERFNPIIRPWAIELHRRGKGTNEVRCAVMRRLIHIAFGVLKHQKSFNPNMAA